MKNMQTKMMSEFVWNHIQHDMDNPFNDVEQVGKFIDEKIRRIDHHEKLVIDPNNKNFPIQKVDGFDDLTTISVDATLIDYQTLENYFHENIRRESYL
jgi:hypothetical protein